MIYGQALYKRKLRSCAAVLDIVAHELFHGVIGSTARLEYEGETGALNKSDSDIFAVLISNWKVPGGIDAWNWRLGDGVSDDYPEGMRDFEDPARFSGGPDAQAIRRPIRSTGTTTGASTTRRTRAACTTTAASIITPPTG